MVMKGGVGAGSRRRSIYLPVVDDAEAHYKGIYCSQGLAGTT